MRLRPGLGNDRAGGAHAPCARREPTGRTAAEPVAAGERRSRTRLIHGVFFGSSSLGDVRSTTTSIHFAQNAPGSLPVSSVSTSSAWYAAKCSGQEDKELSEAALIAAAACWALTVSAVPWEAGSTSGSGCSCARFKWTPRRSSSSFHSPPARASPDGRCARAGVRRERIQSSCANSIRRGDRFFWREAVRTVTSVLSGLRTARHSDICPAASCEEGRPSHLPS